MAEFKLPDLGEGVHEGQIIRLLAKEGASIREDDPFMEVETDKAAVEIASPFTGVLTKWHVEEGQLVHVGDVMATFEGGEEVVVEVKKKEVVAAATTVSTSVAPAHATKSNGRRKPASPAVRKLARTMGLDIDTITGSGPGGRVTRADIESASGNSSLPVNKSGNAVASPAPLPTPVKSTEPPGKDGKDQYGPIKTQPISQARKTIAANMTQSWSTIPHVTDSDDADVTNLDALRRGYPSAENGNRKITMLAFVIRAVARALAMHPEFNAHFDQANNQIIYKRYINVAVGVHTERGLVAPIIPNTDQLSVLQIADALDEIVDKARKAKFTVNETRGGTYTISNAGAFGGSRYSTPIITPGQCAVLAIGKSRQMPWVVDGEIQPRLIMPLSHSFDHRLADGGQEIAFMRSVIEALENPARLLL